jgi:N-acetylneuraminic acid mutarotase
VAAAADRALWLFGGAAIQSQEGQPRRLYLRDAWCYRPGRGWEAIADLPSPVAAAASPAPVAASRIFVVGGDDGSLAGFSPAEKHPGFAGRVLVFDTTRNRWQVDEAPPFGTVTLPTAFWNVRFVLPSGEVRPGVRSPKVWTFRLEP